MRLALIVIVLFPALALAQDKDKDADKVSNDQPDRPLQMPPASTEVKEAIDDFDRFGRRGAWERALKRSTPSRTTSLSGSSTERRASSSPSRSAGRF